MNNFYNYYTSFYVFEPFSSLRLYSSSSKDYCYYIQLKKWAMSNKNFVFNDVHENNYNVRENEPWECVIRPRIHERLNNANKFILILSRNTHQSWAINEEIEYGIGVLHLPVVVIYPEYNSIEDLLDEETADYNSSVKKLWDRLPSFKKYIGKVDIQHLPMNREVLINSIRQ